MPDGAPRELNRLDIKNWTPTPAALSAKLAAQVRELATEVDGFIIMDQVSLAETGVVTSPVLAAVAEVATRRPELPILADSRRGLREYPAVTLKMNAHELAALTDASVTDPGVAATNLARTCGSRVIVTLAECGLVGASPDNEAPVVIPAWPVRGEIDVVGAGDAVTANITAALAAGATFAEALACGNAAASIVIHQLGTTGTASRDQLAGLLATT
jgi:bifunctional ADP-heptose synthase (sugar kinase/adenylyltransferase)